MIDVTTNNGTSTASDHRTSAKLPLQPKPVVRYGKVCKRCCIHGGASEAVVQQSELWLPVALAEEIPQVADKPDEKLKCL